MPEKFQIIARYSDGKPTYWIGRKLDPSKPLDEDNVEWKKKDGVPLKFSEYTDAEKACKAKN